MSTQNKLDPGWAKKDFNGVWSAMNDCRRKRGAVARGKKRGKSRAKSAFFPAPVKGRFLIGSFRVS